MTHEEYAAIAPPPTTEETLRRSLAEAAQANGCAAAYPHDAGERRLHGLTKREAFALAAMQGLLAQTTRTESGYAIPKYEADTPSEREVLAIDACACADAVLLQLAKVAT